MGDVFVAVYEVGPQGVLIDCGYRGAYEDAMRAIEHGWHNFKKGREYVCLPLLTVRVSHD